MRIKIEFLKNEKKISLFFKIIKSVFGTPTNSNKAIKQFSSIKGALNLRM